MGGLYLVVVATTLLIALSSCDEEQQQSLEWVELCGYFGGHCLASNCRIELRHRWNISLCANSMMCCGDRPPPTPVSQSISNHVPTAEDNQNECQGHGGICMAWYNNCTDSAGFEGTEADHACDLGWQSCCMFSLHARPAGGGVADSHAPTPVSGGHRQEAEPNHERRSTPPPSLPAGSCGRQTRAPRQKRIIGGSLSPSGTWPWHVGIKSALGYIHCAGTIIHNKWVLTAAHCFKRVRNYSLYRVMTGTHPQQQQRSYTIRQVIKHSLYKEHDHRVMVGHSHKYDIALVELNETITYSNTVQPACLPSPSNVFDGRTCWLTGWGSTKFNSTEDNFRLRHVQGTVLSRSACRNHWGQLVDSKMLCFGNQRKGGCTGDSGGGMFCEDGDGRFTVAGIISWGSAKCNEKSTVLTSLAAYKPWIDSIINR